jgi:hypothetical protein
MIRLLRNLFLTLISIGFTTRTPPVTPTVNLSVSTATASEAAGTVVTVTATAASPVTGAQTVTLAVSGNHITAGDYSLSGTTITIPDGATQKMCPQRPGPKDITSSALPSPMVA